jgi:hypothetical protein
MRQRWDAQVYDHRFVVDADPGAVERNIKMSAIALQRAAERNGGQDIPPSPAPSAVSSDSPAAQAVSGPRRSGTDGAVSSPDAGEGDAPRSKAGVDTGPLRSATMRKDPYVVDSSISWGRSGQVEANRERGAETIPREAAQSSGVYSGPMLGGVSPQPEILPGPGGSRFDPDADHSAGNWGMREISAFKIGG